MIGDGERTVGGQGKGKTAHKGGDNELDHVANCCIQGCEAFLKREIFVSFCILIGNKIGSSNNWGVIELKYTKSTFSCLLVSRQFSGEESK